MLGKLFKSKEKVREWTHNFTYLRGHSDFPEEVDCKLHLVREGKQSRVYFEVKKSDKEIKLPIDTFSYQQIIEKTPRRLVKIEYDSKLLELDYTDEQGRNQKPVFNMPNRKTEKIFFHLEQFIKEYEHNGYDLTYRTRSGLRTVNLNLYDARMHSELGEERLWDKKIPISRTSEEIIITNFRIFTYDKDDDAITGFTLFPIDDCHAENVRTEYKSKTSGSSYGKTTDWGGIKHNVTTTETSITLGDVVIFDEGREFLRISMQNPQDLVNRINGVNNSIFQDIPSDKNANQPQDMHEEPKSGIAKWCAVLEVSENASCDEIKKAYQNMILVWHSDRFQKESLKEKADQKTREIVDAYENLSEAKKCD
ncbi:MAG: J domain-containing protein [Nitrosopumilus sp.]|uniref:J domain-containing protein n=1 Tax=Nitrosopumilus sp. TaxID=2024843 RepID=UPI00243334E4|nr:J domain-containing protein [Nitrosopumilus sp.]MCV0366384.1 J domain-containing protein [Nitrosopumilus sp.]